MHVKRLTAKEGGSCHRARAYDGRKAVGAIVACETYTKGQSVLQVDKINVHESHQRRGVGTLLYREMSDIACEEGVALASSPKWARSSKSSGFWNKQLAKGRAKDIGDGVIVLNQKCGADLSELQPIAGQPGLFLEGYAEPQSGDCEVVERDTGGKLSAEFVLRCKIDPQDTSRHLTGRKVTDYGNISLIKKKLKGRVVWAVDGIYLVDHKRRKGYGTKLYEAAAAFACRNRSALASTSRNPGAFSNDFWEKQERKGRATRIRQRGAPDDAFVLHACTGSPFVDLSSFSPPKRWPLYAAGAGLLALILLTNRKA